MDASNDCCVFRTSVWSKPTQSAGKGACWPQHFGLLRKMALTEGWLHQSRDTQKYVALFSRWQATTWLCSVIKGAGRVSHSELCGRQHMKDLTFFADRQDNNKRYLWNQAQAKGTQRQRGDTAIHERQTVRTTCEDILRGGAGQRHTQVRNIRWSEGEDGEDQAGLMGEISGGGWNTKDGAEDGGREPSK